MALDTGDVTIDACPWNADYTQERYYVDCLRHWQNHTPLYPPADTPNDVHEAISLLSGIEAGEMKRRMHNG